MTDALTTKDPVPERNRVFVIMTGAVVTIGGSCGGNARRDEHKQNSQALHQHLTTGRRAPDQRAPAARDKGGTHGRSTSTAALLLGHWRW
jgi:hypothetical protein